MNMESTRVLRKYTRASNVTFAFWAGKSFWTWEEAAFILAGYSPSEFRYYADESKGDLEAIREVIEYENITSLAQPNKMPPKEWVRFALGRGVEVSPLLLKFFPGERSIFEEVEALRSEIELLTRLGPYCSEKLAKMNLAARKLWGDVDHNYWDAHPTNKKVTEWLVTNGFDETPAKHAASLIRPEWAAKGRPQEK